MSNWGKIHKRSVGWCNISKWRHRNTISVTYLIFRLGCTQKLWRKWGSCYAKGLWEERHSFLLIRPSMLRSWIWGVYHKKQPAERCKVFLTFAFFSVHLSATVNFTTWARCMTALLKTLRKTYICNQWPIRRGFNKFESVVTQAGTNESEKTKVIQPITYSRFLSKATGKTTSNLKSAVSGHIYLFSKVN